MSLEIVLLLCSKQLHTIGGGFIHKEELIQLHTLMVQMKKFFEESGHGEFLQYQSLQISPIHVHRSKAEHKHAIFILGKEIASVMTLDEFSGPGRTQVRMQELASRAVDEMMH
jgi:hypothetical protein